MFHTNVQIRIIGTRHGEKIYETLVTREEMAKAEDLHNYYRIPCDARNLNYDKLESGSEKISQAEEYNSHNTKHLDIAQMKKLLYRLEIIKNELKYEK
jgi:UDP-glucose 4-epimerase